MGFDNKPGIVIKTDSNKKAIVSDSIVVYNNDHNSAAGIDGDNVTVSSGDGKYTRLENGKLTYDDGQVREFNLPSNKEQGIYTLATTDDYPIDDPQDQLFISLTGQESTFYKKVNLSDAPGRMFYVNLSALNPVFKDGLTSTYNEQTNQLEVGLNAVIPSTATSTSTSTVTPTTGTFVTGTSTNTTNVVNSVTYTPSSETLTFTYDDNTTASFTFLTSSTTVTSGTTSVVSSVTDSTSNAMTGATVSTSTTTTLS